MMINLDLLGSLVRIEADPVMALQARTSLPAWQKAAVAARALAGVRR